MDAAEEVKNHLDVVDVVGEYLQLKPAGSGSFRACCPFHQEKTPSFFVNRQRQSWHCFGCNKGGDLISFVMEMEGMDFRDALEHLATKAGVTLPAFNTEAAGERKRLYAINDLAARFFRAQLLQSPAAEHARQYAAKRGIDDLMGDLFRIGYAPAEWDALRNALVNRGVTEQELHKAGLVAPRQRGDGFYDRFRDRLMFAIQDVHGNVIGFTGRLLDPEAKEAKYVNTPETPVFKKSMVLFGLDKAKGDIKSKDLCVLVEGNMDVLSSHRVNASNVVCPGGTALTADQLRLISRFTKNLAIAFDADSAGIEATLRGLDLARAEDFSIRVISLPPGIKDPDEAIANDPNIWAEAVRNAEDIMDWVFRSTFKGRNLSDPNEKREIARAVLPEIARIADPIVRDHWIKRLAGGLGTSDEALRETMKAGAKGSGGAGERGKREIRNSEKAANPEAENGTVSREQMLAERTLALAVIKPEFIKRIPEDFAAEAENHEELSALYNFLTSAYTSSQFNEALRPEVLHTPEQHIERLMNYLAILADREYPNRTPDALASELNANLSALISARRAKTLSRLADEMRAAECSGDRDRIAELQKAFNELTSST